MKTIYSLALLAITAAILPSCKKDQKAPEIRLLGTWKLSTMNNQQLINSNVVSNDTAHFGDAGLVVTFKNNDSFQAISTSGPNVSGAYRFSGEHLYMTPAYIGSFSFDSATFQTASGDLDVYKTYVDVQSSVTYTIYRSFHFKKQ